MASASDPGKVAGLGQVSAEFVIRCIQGAGDHLRLAERANPSTPAFEKHIELAKTYAAVLKAIR